MRKQDRQKGFTLIELMVVISIISFISNALLYSLVTTRVKARDAKRKQDIRVVRDALAMYYGDNEETYPDCGGWTYSSDEDWDTEGCLKTELAPYLNRMPIDPIANGSPWVTGSYNYAYQVRPDLKEYDLVTQLETLNDPDTCQFKQWRWRTGNEESWCSEAAGNDYSPYLYADH